MYLRNIDISIENCIDVKLYFENNSTRYVESTIDPAIIDPANIAIPFEQFANDENLITSWDLDISYKILKDDNPKPENVNPAKRLIIDETIILPSLLK